MTGTLLKAKTSLSVAKPIVIHMSERSKDLWGAIMKAEDGLSTKWVLIFSKSITGIGKGGRKKGNNRGNEGGKGERERGWVGLLFGGDVTIYLLFCSYYPWSKATPWELAPLNFWVPSSDPSAADMREESRRGRRTQMPGSSLRMQTQYGGCSSHCWDKAWFGETMTLPSSQGLPQNPPTTHFSVAGEGMADRKRNLSLGAGPR